ncbi:MAG: hypothetical protein VW268_13710 [Rhodospirillaceae bacterium]
MRRRVSKSRSLSGPVYPAAGTMPPGAVDTTPAMNTGFLPRSPPPADAEAQCTVGFTDGDLDLHDPGIVLTFQRPDVPARVQHGDGQGLALDRRALRQRAVEDFHR